MLHEENQTDSASGMSSSENLEAENKETAIESTVETSSVEVEEETTSALDELIEAIKKELSSSEAASETENETVPESEASDDVDEEEEEAEAYSDEVYLIDDIHTENYQSDTDSEIYLATASNASGYAETVINRMDNILTCAIITACCAVLILLHTLKKE